MTSTNFFLILMFVMFIIGLFSGAEAERQRCLKIIRLGISEWKEQRKSIAMLGKSEDPKIDKLTERISAAGIIEFMIDGECS